MLIRIAGHFLMNPQHIDKLICIKGLPDDWMFVERADGRKQLKAPWEPDIDANIPAHVRPICEPMKIVQYFSPTEKGKEGITDERTILGVKINFMTEPGRAMWTKVQRYMDASIPRDQQIPEPVLVAKDQRSPFETFTPRKRVTGGLELEPSDVPVVDLNKPVPAARPLLEPQAAPSQQKVSPPSESKPPAAVFKCEHCEYTSEKERGVRMHSMKRHKKEMAGTKA